MRGTDRAINRWLDPAFELPHTVYVDAQYYKLLWDWLRADLVRVQLLFTRKLYLVLYTRQLHEIFDPDSDRDSDLRSVGVEFRPIGLRQQDKPFLVEALRAYFHNDVNARPQALLYTLARRDVGSNSRLSILSQHRGFRRIPMVDTYYFPDAPLEGPDALPAQFDFFEDMSIHPAIRRAAVERMQNSETALAVQQSVQSVYDRLRQLVNCTLDGQDLIIYCLSREAWEQADKKHLVGAAPRIRINPFFDDWERKEQLGLRDIGIGIQRVIRNPLAHKPVTDPYIMSRFSESREALKLLCLLSYFVERMEAPKP